MSSNHTSQDTKALAQLPFLGKQTVPATIRKDLWRPLATVSFPHAHQGLLAYQALREFRKRHELEWDPAQFQGMSKKQRGRKLRDQKANTVADLAAVLGRQEEVARESEGDREIKSEEERSRRARLDEVLKEKKHLRMELAKVAEGSKEEVKVARYRELKRQKMRLMKDIAAAEAGIVKPKAPWERKTKQRPTMSMDGVKIEWADLLDAEFAKTWPQSVVHDVFAHAGNRGRYQAPSVVKPFNVEEQFDYTPEDEVNMVESGQTEEVASSSTLDRIVRRLQFGSKGAV